MNRHRARSTCPGHCGELQPLHLRDGHCEQEPPLGAHLVSPRRHYRHHGIYVGHGRVIHYAGLSRSIRRGPIEEVALEHFAHGHELWWQVHENVPFATGVIIERARSRLGENRYRLLTNNCEHLCHWCLFGETVSAQIDRWLAPPARAWQLLRAVTRGPRSRNSATFTAAAASAPPAMTSGAPTAATWRVRLISRLLILTAACSGCPQQSTAVPLMVMAQCAQSAVDGRTSGPLAAALPGSFTSEHALFRTPLPYLATGPLQRFVDTHRHGLPILILWNPPHHLVAFGIDPHGVPGLYLLPQE